jgi:hypothetical protein
MFERNGLIFENYAFCYLSTLLKENVTDKQVISESHKGVKGTCHFIFSFIIKCFEIALHLSTRDYSVQPPICTRRLFMAS